VVYLQPITSGRAVCTAAGKCNALKLLAATLAIKINQNIGRNSWMLHSPVLKSAATLLLIVSFEFVANRAKKLIFSRGVF
jgi:hypothetical protein